MGENEAEIDSSGRGEKKKTGIFIKLLYQLNQVHMLAAASLRNVLAGYAGKLNYHKW